MPTFKWPILCVFLQYTQLYLFANHCYLSLHSTKCSIHFHLPGFALVLDTTRQLVSIYDDRNWNFPSSMEEKLNSYTPTFDILLTMWTLVAALFTLNVCKQTCCILTNLDYEDLNLSGIRVSIQHPISFLEVRPEKKLVKVYICQL